MGDEVTMMDRLFAWVFVSEAPSTPEQWTLAIAFCALAGLLGFWHGWRTGDRPAGA